MGLCAIGYNVNMLSNPDSELGVALQRVVALVGKRLVNPVPALWPLMHPFGHMEYKRCRKVFLSAIEDMIKTKHARMAADKAAETEAKESASSRTKVRDLLDLLMQAKDPETGRSLTDDEIRDEMVTFMFAGFESITSTMGWYLYWMAKNPEVQAKVHEELDRVLGGRAPSYEDVPRLDYTQRTLWESARMTPAVTTVTRGNYRQTTLGKWTIPENSMIIISSFSLHHDPDLWTEPSVFNPDRWLEKKNRTHSYLPFGGGARICIGRRFAEMEMTQLGIIMMQHFSMALDPANPIKDEAVLTSGPVGLNLFLTERTRPAVVSA